MKKTFSLLILAFAVLSAFAAPKKAEPMEAYLFVYFTNNSPEGEQLRFAVSMDGYNYTPLNNGAKVFDVDNVARWKCIRDPHILRGEDGRTFYMVMTDMRCTEGWSSNDGIVMMKSTDLVNWTAKAVDFPTVFPDLYTRESLTRVWAPQVFWNPDYVWPNGERGGYMIYYSMWNPAEEEYDRMYYSYADKSFTKLTKPRLLFDWGYATIDADINYLESDGLYHMLIKKEGGQPGIFHATASSLHGPWAEPDELDFVNFEGNKKCEGCSAFQIKGEKGWRVAYIQYSTKPRHYRICQSDEHLTNFRDPHDIEGVANPQHGSFMRITKKEYKRLAKWGGIMNNE